MSLICHDGMSISCQCRQILAGAADMANILLLVTGLVTYHLLTQFMSSQPKWILPNQLQIADTNSDISNISDDDGLW